MRIYLVGYMGSGKSSLGRRLARYAGIPFIDLDKYIEERNCSSVPQIFARDGEEGFRKLEHKALEEVSEFTDAVVATGGGAPCFFDNMELMNRTGITLFLDIHPEILTRHLARSKTERPLLKGKSPEELEEFIAENLQKRRPFYEQSRFRIDRSDMEPEEIMKIIEGI
jgi:shikimate kinase